MSNPEDVVVQAAAGNLKAFQFLAIDHHERLAAYFAGRMPARLRGYLDADDLVQETFKKAWRKIADFRSAGVDSFTHWLRKIAKHTLIEVVRWAEADKRGGGRAAVSPQGADSSHPLHGLLEAVAAEQTSPTSNAARNEAQSHLAEALRALPDDRRTAITYRYVDQLDVEQTAAKMKRTKPAVMKLCYFGLQQMRRELGSRSKYFSA